MPEWALREDSPIGNQTNVTTTVLYKVDLAALGKKDYDAAFKYVSDLTDPAMGEEETYSSSPKR